MKHNNIKRLANSSNLNVFINQYIISNPNALITMNDLVETYRMYCINIILVVNNSNPLDTTIILIMNNSNPSGTNIILSRIIVIHQAQILLLSRIIIHQVEILLLSRIIAIHQAQILYIHIILNIITQRNEISSTRN